MSYVAERQGGGPQDLLRGFESFRSCKNVDRFYGKQWLDLRRVMFLHRPFFVRLLFLCSLRHAPDPKGHAIHKIGIVHPPDGHVPDTGEVRDQAGHFIGGSVEEVAIV